ncbi:MAG: aspartate kinase [Candidatus Roizmanbacteria bacterium]|nr:aspartate kinase [Candidatus Roizmanbacteria bacterium]
MITVPQVVRQVIQRSPFLGEALHKDIINYTGLARDIRKEVERDTMKEVEIGSIVMALKRLKSGLKDTSQLSKALGKTPDLIVRSNLIELTLKNSDTLLQNQIKIIKLLKKDRQNFTTITQGVFETTIISNRDNKSIIKELFNDEKMVSELDNLSSITIHFNDDIVHIPGVYYMILKILAWDGMEIAEVVSTNSEFTIILKEAYVDRAFSLIKKLFSP